MIDFCLHPSFESFGASQAVHARLSRLRPLSMYSYISPLLLSQPCVFEHIFSEAHVSPIVSPICVHCFRLFRSLPTVTILLAIVIQLSFRRLRKQVPQSRWTEPKRGPSSPSLTSTSWPMSHLVTRYWATTGTSAAWPASARSRSCVASFISSV